MPRGRPANKDKIVAKKAEEERQANLTQEEVEAEGEGEKVQSEEEQVQAEKQTEHDKEPKLHYLIEGRKAKAAKKAVKSSVGTARFLAHHEKIRNMSAEARKAYYASNGVKGKAKRKRLQGDLLFPVRKVKKEMKGLFGMKKQFKNSRSERINITTEAAIFTSAVIEYLTAEVLELSGECSKQMKRGRIVPRHIMSAVRMDDELVILFPRELTISTAGVLPKPMPSFLAKNNVPRSEWTAGPNEIFRETAISAPSRKSQSVSTKGEINNNK